MGFGCGSRNCRLPLDKQSRNRSTGSLVPPGLRRKCPPRWDGPSADLRGPWKGWRGIHSRQSLVRWALSRWVEPVPMEDRQRLAAYLAKYTTESSDGGDAFHHRLADGELASLDLGEQLRRLAQVAWDLGAERALKRYGLRQGAHRLSYRGHWLTKSPYWSTRTCVPRQARQDYRARGTCHLADEPAIRHCAYSGTGHRSEAATWLANASYDNRRLNRRARWAEE